MIVRITGLDRIRAHAGRAVRKPRVDAAHRLDQLRRQARLLPLSARPDKLRDQRLCDVSRRARFSRKPLAVGVLSTTMNVAPVLRRMQPRWRECNPDSSDIVAAHEQLAELVALGLRGQSVAVGALAEVGADLSRPKEVGHDAVVGRVLSKRQAKRVSFSSQDMTIRAQPGLAARRPDDRCCSPSRRS